MVQIQEFIVNNYFPIIIACIAILMIFIGFIADKTNFGENVGKKAKKSKEELNQSSTTEIKPIENNNIEELSNVKEDSEVIIPTDLSKIPSTTEESAESNVNDDNIFNNKETSSHD